MTDGSAWRRFFYENARIHQLQSNTKVNVAQLYTISLALYGSLSCRKTGHIYWQKNIQQFVFYAKWPQFKIISCTFKVCLVKFRKLLYCQLLTRPLLKFVLKTKKLFHLWYGFVLLVAVIFQPNLLSQSAAKRRRLKFASTRSWRS